MRGTRKELSLMPQDAPLENPENSESETRLPGPRQTEWDRYLNESPPEKPTGFVGEGDHHIPGGTEEKVQVTGDRINEDDLAISSKAEAITPFEQKLEDITNQLSVLRKEFQVKIKTDAHKDKIIDNLHEELQQYKSNHLKKYFLPTIMDIIQFIDGMRKITHYLTLHQLDDNTPQQATKLINLLKSIPEDLEDICCRQGIRPFKCTDNTFDPSRQRILKKLDTPDRAKDKTVAESLRPGYVWDGEVIRPEMVSVYIYRTPELEKKAGDSDDWSSKKNIWY